MRKRTMEETFRSEMDAADRAHKTRMADQRRQHESAVETLERTLKTQGESARTQLQVHLDETDALDPFDIDCV